jgi:hypothetical protein
VQLRNVTDFIPLPPNALLTYILSSRYGPRSAAKPAGDEQGRVLAQRSDCRLASASHGLFLRDLDGYAKLVVLDLLRKESEEGAATRRGTARSRSALADLTAAANRAVVEIQLGDYVEEFLAASVGAANVEDFLRAMVRHCT